MNGYRLLTTRDGESYKNELTYNGKEVDFILSAYLTALFDEHGLSHIRVLANFPDFNSLEFKISEEKLK